MADCVDKAEKHPKSGPYQYVAFYRGALSGRSGKSVPAIRTEWSRTGDTFDDGDMDINEGSFPDTTKGRAAAERWYKQRAGETVKICPH